MTVFRQKGLKAVLPKTTTSQSWHRSSRRLEDLQGTQGERWQVLAVPCVGQNSEDLPHRTPTSWHSGGCWNPRKVWGCFSTGSRSKASWVIEKEGMFFIDLSLCPWFKAKKVVSGIREKDVRCKLGRLGLVMKSEHEFSWITKLPPQRGG